jgi:hypothetical protein
MQTLEPADDLLGRPTAPQASTDKRLEFGRIQLAFQRALAPPTFGQVLGGAGEVIRALTVALEFPGHHGRTSPDGNGNFLLGRPILAQLSYAIAFAGR